MTGQGPEPAIAGRAQLVYPTPPEHVRRGGLRGALRLFGPGAIIASVTIGSGETLFSSRAGAIFGYALLWFIALCILCKLVQVYTAARYLVLTGEHPMGAWARFPGPRGWFPAGFGLLSILCYPFWLGGLAMMLGTAINWILGLDHAEPQLQRLYAQCFGTATLVLAVVLTLVQPYAVLEKAQMAIVALLILVILAALVVTPVPWCQVLVSTFWVRIPGYAGWMRQLHPDIVARETVVLSMGIFMGAIGGGPYDYLGYLSLFREKGWGGLGAGQALEDHRLPPVIDQTAANLAAGRQWLRAPVVDVFAGFLCVAVFAMAFNILGAAILHPKHVVPKEFALLTPQVEFLTQFGAGFKYLYQVGIFMAFWGTIYGAFEVYSRTAYECARPLWAGVRHAPYTKFRLPVCLYAGIGGIILMWTVESPVDIVKPAALIGTITCGIWCFAMIWADRTSLPRPLRMNAAWAVLNLVAGAILVAFGLRAIVDYGQDLCGG